MNRVLENLITIKITGLITSFHYQKAKFCAERLYMYLPYKFAAPQVRGLLEVDWTEFILKERRKKGGELWAITSPVIVYFNDIFLGTDEELLRYIANYFSFSLPIENAVYVSYLLNDYFSCLRKTKRLYVNMDISIEGKAIGSILFMLYSELLPTTCGNFSCLCTGEKGISEDGITLHYKETLIHRIVKDGWVQAGDIQNKTGGGGVSIYGPTFADESYCISHDRRGVLSMANDCKHSNGSQFCITLNPTPWMDRYYVAFGQMVEGVKVLETIEEVETYYGKPLKRITIENCNTLNLVEKKKKRIQDLEPEAFDTEEEEEKEYFELVDELGQMPQVMDARDVPSFLSEERFLRGLYSFTPPKNLLGSASSSSPIRQKDSAHDAVINLIRLVESSLRLGREIKNVLPENVTYARLIAFDLLRNAMNTGREYETLWDSKNFALMITEEIIRRARSGNEFEERSADMSEIAEEILRKALEGPDYEPRLHIQDFISHVTGDIVRRSVDIAEYKDLFPYSAMIAHEVIKNRNFSGMLQTGENIFSDETPQGDEIVSIALELVKDVMDTVEICESVEKEKGEKTVNWVERILHHLVRESVSD